MKSSFSTIASILLLFNGFGALYGGWSLMAHPDGSSLGMSVNLLAHSPFRDYLIPGIVLFISNGIASIGAFIGFMIKPRKLAWLVWAQGVILLVWLLVQIVMIETLHPLQFILGATGITLILLGRSLADKNNR